jgi:hypothetical protein
MIWKNLNQTWASLDVVLLIPLQNKNILEKVVTIVHLNKQSKYSKYKYYLSLNDNSTDHSNDGSDIDK